MRRSLLFSVLFGFCGGIILTEIWIAPFWFSTGLMGAATVLLFLRGAVKNKVWLTGLAILLFSIALGEWRGQAWNNPGNSGLELLAGQSIRFRGDLVDQPIIRNNQQEFELVRITVDDQPRRGKISIRLPVYPAIQLGQQVLVQCDFKTFSERSRIRQRSHDVRGYCGHPEIVETSIAPWSWRLTLGRIKDWSIRRLTSELPEPQASLLVGILLGRQVPMPPELDQAFRATGTTHIIALSGFNITIILTALSAGAFRIMGKRWAWLPIIFFVSGFVVMTGASASVTRAGIMAGATLLATRLGRSVSMLRLLAYSLLAMVWHNPLILMHDLGFQLSFLATVGLVYVAPGIQAGLKYVPQSFSLRENLGTTLGAIIMTEPLLLWHFARVSIVAPFVNMIILPLVPLAMSFGFVCLVAPPLWPMADAILRRIIQVIQFGAQLPFALQTIDGWAVGILAMLLMGLVTRLIRKQYASQTCAA